MTIIVARTTANTRKHFLAGQPIHRFNYSIPAARRSRSGGFLELCPAALKWFLENMLRFERHGKTRTNHLSSESTINAFAAWGAQGRSRTRADLARNPSRPRADAGFHRRAAVVTLLRMRYGCVGPLGGALSSVSKDQPANPVIWLSDTRL